MNSTKFEELWYKSTARAGLVDLQNKKEKKKRLEARLKANEEREREWASGRAGY